MIPDKKLSEIFGQFAGREVDATEITNKRTIGGTEYTLTHVEINHSDPAITELKAFAKEKGYLVRLWAEGDVGTCDWIDNRVNVDITQEADGKFRIQPTFRIG